MTARGGALAGRQLLVPDEPGTPWEEMLNGTYDRTITDRVGKAVRPGSVIWDVGSHFGFHALGFAAMVGDTGRVVAFEPNPANLARLKLHLERNKDLAPRVLVVEAAVSDHDGEGNFVRSTNIDNGDSSCSFVEGAIPPRDAGAYADFGRIKVKILALDSWLAKNAAPGPQVMKIDVEGAELLVLQGGRTVLERFRPTIVMEVHNIQLMFHVQSFLHGLGYRMELLNESWAAPSRCLLLCEPN